MESTTCQTCQRAVWASDVDRNGNCVLCAPVAPGAESVAPVPVRATADDADVPAPTPSGVGMETKR